jgi:hypothetical protein
MQAVARYVYWKVGAYDDDPGMQIMRLAIMREAEEMVKKTTTEITEKLFSTQPPTKNPENLN